ncbi:MAG TPA: hypothetical protein VNU01_04160, partial [Egibacteraceae bacterium]|nr:hypothetical protein [Egibacteraceae bacterium]
GPGQGQFDADAFLAFAECMRANGVEDFPDPGADGRPNVEAMQGLDRSSEEFQSASETCADEVGFEGPMGGGRGGFGGPGGPRGGPGGQA